MSLFTLWDQEFLGKMFWVMVPVAEKVLRPVIVYVFLVVTLRIFGKRELAQLNPFDLVVLLCLSNTVQNAIIGDDNSVTGGLIGGFTLCAFNYFVVRFLFRHRRLDQLIEGRPTVLVDQGHICKNALRKELMTRSEVLSLAHRLGFASLDEVDRLVLEPGGTFYIHGKEPRLSDRHHAELLDRLDGLARQVEGLRRLADKPAAPGVDAEPEAIRGPIAPTPAVLSDRVGPTEVGPENQ